jgi:hypothetical protein
MITSKAVRSELLIKLIPHNVETEAARSFAAADLFTPTDPMACDTPHFARTGGDLSP